MAQKVDYAALKKGGYMRQKQKGYGSLRLAVIGGNLTAENIKKVAEVAEKYGRGYVHMTSRQGIEIPFIKVEELAEVKEELAKGGVRPTCPYHHSLPGIGSLSQRMYRHLHTGKRTGCQIFRTGTSA